MRFTRMAKHATPSLHCEKPIKDAMSGQTCDNSLVAVARRKELEYSLAKGVWLKRPRSEAYRLTGKRLISPTRTTEAGPWSVTSDCQVGGDLCTYALSRSTTHRAQCGSHRLERSKGAPPGPRLLNAERRLHSLMCLVHTSMPEGIRT